MLSGDNPANDALWLRKREYTDKTRLMKILFFEDDARDVARASAMIVDRWPDSSIVHVETPEELRGALSAADYDLVLADFNVYGVDGRTALRVAREAAPNTPVIFVSGTIGEETAFDLIREGASDYVLKDRMDRLLMVIPRALHERDERRRRLKAEADLRESEERFRSMFLTMVEGVVLLDEEGRIISANASASRILGQESTEMLGRRFAGGWHAIHDDLSPFAMELFPSEIARRTGKAQLNVVMGVYQPSMKLVWAVVHAQPVPRAHDEGSYGVVLTMHDISEKKSLEEQLFRAQRLESLGLLAAGIAHDLNNVLAPILMGAPLLRDRSTQPADQRLLAAMEKSALRGAALVRQILGFTKGAGKSPGPIQLKHLIKEMLVFLQASLPKSICVESDIPASPWLVQGDPTQLQQVLLNLCVNARDAMNDRGTLKLDVKNYHVDLQAALAFQTIPSGMYLQIEVSDTGPGIPPNILEQIWEPFFTTKGVDKGTGLGLSTVRGIIQHHHGFVDVRTELGKGTTFRILLPATAEAEGTLDRKSTAHPFPRGQGQGELILVVDDEPAIREIATKLLTDQNYRTITAADGLQGYSQLLLRGGDIRLVITDLSMPELDGAALALMVRSQVPGARVVIMSGKDSMATGAVDYRQYCDAFLQKPFKPEALLATVDKLLHHERAV